MGYIYKIQNLINNKIYIGQTSQKYPNSRWSAHKREAQNGNDRPLYRAIRKYGIDNFQFIIMLKNIPNDKLDYYERLWISKMNTQTPNGYNISPGGGVLRGKDNPMYGKPSPFRGIKRPEISEMMKKCMNNPEVKKIYSERMKGKNNPMYGKHLSDETKKKNI